MRLTSWTDYALRVLMYCAACRARPDPVTITEVATAHGISRSHLTKVVMALAAKGWLETTRGRGGGLRLMRPAEAITVGEVVRAMETDFCLVECFDAGTDACRLTGHCQLQGLLGRALKQFMAELDRATLADLLQPGPGGRPGREVPGLPLAQAMTRRLTAA